MSVQWTFSILTLHKSLIKKNYICQIVNINLWYVCCISCRGTWSHDYVHQQVPVHRMARHPNQSSKPSAPKNWFRATNGTIQLRRCPSALVGPVLGPNRMLQQSRKVHLRHRRLRLRPSRMRRQRCGSTRNTGGATRGGQRWTRLL